MRKLKEWGRNFQSGLRNRKRVAEVARELQRHFGLPSPPQLAQRDQGGRDSVYLVSHGGKNIGVLRLANPYKDNPPLPPGTLRALLDTAARMDYERAVYAKGAARGLTPEPLWHAPDALLCEYVPCKRMQAAMDKAPDAAWDILLRAAGAVSRLHRAELTHMDVSLHNMLEDARGNIYFIDFEYAPAPHVPAASQRVYDYLHLVESAWKYIPEDKKAAFGPWLEYFSGCMDDAMRHTDIRLLAPALPRITAAKEFSAALRIAFQHGRN